MAKNKRPVPIQAPLSNDQMVQYLRKMGTLMVAGRPLVMLSRGELMREYCRAQAKNAAPATQRRRPMPVDQMRMLPW